jgi:hypothetical protein
VQDTRSLRALSLCLAAYATPVAHDEGDGNVGRMNMYEDGQTTAAKAEAAGSGERSAVTSLTWTGSCTAGATLSVSISTRGSHAAMVSFRKHALQLRGKIHRVDPDFGSTLTVSNRDSQSTRWVNWYIMGQPCEFQVCAAARSHHAARQSTASRPDPGRRGGGHGGGRNRGGRCDRMVRPPRRRWSGWRPAQLQSPTRRRSRSRRESSDGRQASAPSQRCRAW